MLSQNTQNLFWIFRVSSFWWDGIIRSYGDGRLRRLGVAISIIEFREFWWIRACIIDSISDSWWSDYSGFKLQGFSLYPFQTVYYWRWDVDQQAKLLWYKLHEVKFLEFTLAEVRERFQRHHLVKQQNGVISKA